MSSFEAMPLLRRGVLSAPAAAFAGSWLLEELESTEFAAFDVVNLPSLEEMPAPSPAELAAMAAAEEEERRLEADAAREQELADAYAAGVAAGYAEGAAAEHERIASAAAALDAALAQLRAQEARWLGALESNITALAMAAARHVIGREVAADPGALHGVIARALGDFPDDEPLTARVSPEDMAIVADASVKHDVRWMADPMIVRGGCVIEGRERIVDGRVDTALERLYRRLTHANA
jgi:flagellar biosynthesis/type III secretory pathway protein FliH